MSPIRLLRPTSERSARPSRGLRQDIQGLRAVAVLLVVLGHADVGPLSGGYVGVDVFFVLSGFLITGLLLAEATRSGGLSLAGFYVRRARRILPAATLTLVSTVLAAHLLLNFVRARQTAVESIWAAFFGANVYFAKEGTDYFAQGQPPSPVQHYWSLAVEEQFYLVWPLLFSLVFLGLRAKGTGRTGRQRVSAQAARILPSRATAEVRNRRLLLAIIGVSVGSLVWSAYQTSANPPFAYFSPLTRAWELGLGAALAIALSGSPETGRLSLRWRQAMGLMGIAGILAAALLFTEQTPFPGLAALLPTLGAACIIGAGVDPARSPLVSRVLALMPLRYIGDRSYAFYLWHWPVLIIAAQYEERVLPVESNLLLLLLAFLLSILSYRFFENPIRHMTWRSPNRGLVLWPVSLMAVFIIASTVHSAAESKAGKLEGASFAVTPRAAPDLVEQEVLAPAEGSAPAKRSLSVVVRAARAAEGGDPIPRTLNPPLSRLEADNFKVPGPCFLGEGRTRGQLCRMGPASAAKAIAVIGDSHAQMWMPTILAMAKRRGWVVMPFLKSGCLPYVLFEKGHECARWRRWVEGQIRRLRPDVTMLGGHYNFSMEPAVAGLTIDGVERSIKRMKPYSEVMVLGDPPGQSKEPVDCLLSRKATMKRCSHTPTSDQLEVSAGVAETAKTAGAGFVDSAGWFCHQDKCPMVVDGMITFTDTGHISRTYAVRLSRVFGDAFDEELDHLR